MRLQGYFDLIGQSSVICYHIISFIELEDRIHVGLIVCSQLLFIEHTFTIYCLYHVTLSR